MRTIEVKLRNPEKHTAQKRMVESQSRRLIVKAGRRGGKTVGFSIRAVKRFLEGRRQLYAAPTNEQTDTFWYEITRALASPIQEGIFKKNESERFIELPGTKQRIKAKTAWNANTLRGDYADDLYLDEYQLMAEDTWDEVGAPMLLDNNGDAVLIFTPPSLKSVGVSKAKDPRHASKMFKQALKDTTGLWETIHFTSLDNPFISREGLALAIGDMSLDSYRREILAEDDEIELSWLVYSKFNERFCKIPRFPIPENWPVYVGHDFGSANPAALFLAENPGTGDFYAFKEYCPGSGYSTAQHVKAFEEIITLPNQNGGPKRYNVLRRVGGNRTTEEEIRQGYTAHGWPIIAPKLDKVNAQIDRVIGLMELNKIFIFEDLWVVLSQIANCMWKLDDENKPTNVIKDESKYHLLACLVAGTMITTDKGLRPIENIKLGDRVLTRQGYHKVTEAGMTGYKETVTAYFSDGSKLTGTPDHPIFTYNRGWVSLTCLRYNDTIETWKENQLNLTGIPTQDTQILSANRIGYISGLVSGGICTERFGGRLTELYQKVAIFITKMATGLITILPTLSLFQLPYMKHYTTQGNALLLNGNTLQGYKDWEQLGQRRQKDEQGSVSYARNKPYIVSQKLEYVSNAERNLNLISATTINSVLAPVKQHIDMPQARIMKPEYAQSVARSSRPTNIRKSNIVLGNVPHLAGIAGLKRFAKSAVAHLLPRRRPITRPVQEDAVAFLRIEARAKAPTYNLSVDAVPEYYANGILVHNCLRYIASDFTPETVPNNEEAEAWQF